jgi:hypothetical protein
MPVFGVDGLRRRRECRIGEGAYGDRHHVRFAIGDPVHGRPRNAGRSRTLRDIDYSMTGCKRVASKRFHAEKKAAIP